MDKCEQAETTATTTTTETKSNKSPGDKSMTTSSEIFDTWTLVTDKSEGPKMATKGEESDDTSNRVEIIKTGEQIENSNDDDKSKSSSVEASEDLSDGISIISDSDSVGRLSPRRLMRKHPNSIGETYDATNDDDDVLKNDTADASVHSNCCERSSSQTSKTNRHALNNRKRSRSSLEVENTSIINERSFFYPIIRSGLTSFFYVAVFLAILAFIGRLRYPEWQPLVKSSQLTEMEAKLIEMELQNNLLRAEFDILSKQVAFISDRGGASGGDNSQRFKVKNDGFQPPHKNQKRSYPSNGGRGGGGGKFQREFQDWPDDIELRREAEPYSCDGNKNAAVDKIEKCLPPPDGATDTPDTIKTIDTDVPKSFPSHDSFDGMHFPRQKNSKSDFKSGHKNGKNPSKKYSGERYDSRENFKRHEKPMKHQKSPDENHRYKKHPDQQYRSHQHHKPGSGEDFIDSSRERNGNGNRYQRRNSNFENDKNRYRDKTPHPNDDNNWFTARANGRQQARTDEGVRNS